MEDSVARDIIVNRMKNPNTTSTSNDESSNNWLGNDVPEFQNKKDEESETERIKDFYREKYFSKEYDELMSPFLRKIEPGRVKSVNEKIICGDKGELMWGYKQLVYDVADILNLEKRPGLKFLNLSNAQKKDLGMEDTGAFCNGDTVYILNLEDSRHYNRVTSIVDVVAHEMWHIYQQDEIRKGGARADIYRENFENYSDSHSQENFYAYATQPVEAEAYIFGRRFSDAFRHMLIDSLQDDINEYNDAVDRGAYDNPSDEMDEYIYEKIAEEMKRKNDQLEFLRNKKDTDVVLGCSQTRNRGFGSKDVTS